MSWTGAILNSAAAIVPRESREDWLREWRAELWYVDCGKIRFCLGAYRDAAWLRRNAVKRPLLDSPVACILTLVGLAALAGAIALSWRIPHPNPRLDKPFYRFLLIVGIATLTLPATTKFSLGENPRGGRMLLHLFLAAKVALILLFFYFAAATLPHYGEGKGIVIHVLLWSFFFTVRWILSDQRRRCPVCLGLLSHPVHVGQASRIFLGWDGTEFLCRKGHGLLHVPETPTSWYGTQRWLSLER